MHDCMSPCCQLHLCSAWHPGPGSRLRPPKATVTLSICHLPLTLVSRASWTKVFWSSQNALNDTSVFPMKDQELWEHFWRTMEASGGRCLGQLPPPQHDSSATTAWCHFGASVVKILLCPTTATFFSLRDFQAGLKKESYQTQHFLYKGLLRTLFLVRKYSKNAMLENAYVQVFGKQLEMAAFWHLLFFGTDILYTIILLTFHCHSEWRCGLTPANVNAL